MAEPGWGIRAGGWWGPVGSFLWSPFACLFVGGLGGGIRYRGPGLRVLGWVARFRARVVDAAGDAPAWAGSAAPAEFPPGFGHRSGQVAPVLGLGLLLRVGGAVQEFVPRVTTTGVCQAEDPTSPYGAATSPKGQHALHLREPLWGFDSRWSTKSLSHPRPSRCGVLGRSRQPNGSLSLTALCDRTATFPAGVSGFPVTNALPCRGRPPFCVPGDGMWRHGRRRTELPGVCRCGGCRICVLLPSNCCVMPLAGGARRDAPLRGWWAFRRLVGEMGSGFPRSRE